MTRAEAYQILLLYRPGTADADDPLVETALDLARHDPELGRWFHQHVQFQSAMRAKLRQIEVPQHRKRMLLARPSTLPSAVSWCHPPRVWLAAVLTAAICLTLVALWLRPAATNRLANFQERMVSEVLRQYAMEWETNDMARLRQSLAARGGPADYVVPRGVARLSLTGGGVLRWHTNAVSMVCFDRGGGQMLFLFVVKRNALKDPPPAQKPRLTVLHDQMVASWSQGDDAYLLAGPEEESLEAFARKYL